MGFVEELEPGCFADSLRAGGWNGDVVARVEHDPRLLIGRRSSGTLRLKDTPAALTYEVDLPDTQCGRDTAELCARGDLKSTSFCFLVEDYDRDEDAYIADDGTLVRRILRAQLIECSPVSMPAYPQASITVEDHAGETVAEAAARAQREEPGVPTEVNEARLRMAML